ncbi:MAG: heavy-metal-associated domain-containing protein [Bacteroidales bacterium]
MKTLKVLFLSLCTCCLLTTYAQDKKTNPKESTATFLVEFDCKGCAAKVEKNIPFEKGVADLKVDFDKQTVWIKYRNDKTDTTTLKKAFAKIKIPVKRIQ